MATYSNSAREVEMPDGNVVVLHSEPTGGANTTSNIKKFKYDDNGHVTESSAANATDLNLNSYSTPTSGSTAIGTSDAVQTAIGKLDHQSQIDQTNIWYAINNGATNQFFLTNGIYPLGSAASVAADNGELTFTNSSSGTNNADIGTIALKAGTYILTNRYVKVGGSIYGDIRLMDGGTNLTTGEVAEFTLATDKTLTIPAYTYTSALSNPVTIKPLIYDKTLWDQTTDYRPPALPNYDLTRLEAEDRASLAEVVDSGAKNLVNIPNGTITNVSGATITASNGILTISGTATADAWITLTTIPNLSGTYVLSGIQTTTTENQYFLRVEQGSNAVNDFGNSGTANFNGNGTLYLRIKSGYAFGSGTIIKPMLATKAAFCISSAFVPYCKPLASKTDHTYSLGSVDLNDITKDGTYMCSPTANSPVSGVSFLHVYNDTSYDLKQVLQKLNEPSIVYIRHRRFNSGTPPYTWTAWYKFTGTVVS